MNFLTKGWEALNSKRVLTAINVAWVAAAMSLGIPEPIINTIALILGGLVVGRGVEDMGKKK